MAVGVVASGAGEDWREGAPAQAASVRSKTTIPPSCGNRFRGLGAGGTACDGFAVTTEPVCTNRTAQGKVSGGSYLHVRGR